jgi:hypothetical protein
MEFINLIDLDKMELKLERIIHNLKLDEFEGYFIAYVPFALNKTSESISYNLATLKELDIKCLFGDVLNIKINEYQITPDFEKQEYIIKLIL